MEVGKNKLRSIIKQVQNPAEVLAKNIRKLDRSSSLSSINSNNNNTQLDLSSAIEYNYCLVNSYLQERNSRKLSPYEEILKTLDFEENNEESIINSIGKEFFLDPKSLEDSQEEENESNQPNCDEIYDSNNKHLDGQSKIIERCVFSKLPEFSEAAPNLGDEFLNYIENEKNKLNKQQTIVSKRLTEMILTNDKFFKTELDRIRSIEDELAKAVDICSNGRSAFSLSKRDFTENSINIIENYRRRETIVEIIECLQNIKKLRQTVEHIECMLQYEKNFCSAINLFDEKFEILESMSSKYDCVAQMKEKLVETLQLVEDQMDAVLEKMVDRFCLETYSQLSKAYSQIGKSESFIHQLLLYFTNAIHDKAFSIVLGYVKLFTLDNVDSLGPVNASSTTIKTNYHNKKVNEPSNNNESNLKRKPFAELCQYLNPESFLQCLTDLCRALWDIMNNYYQILCFYKKENLCLTASLSDEEINFSVNKLTQGVLRVWSDIQHKIRTLVSSVKFVQVQDINLNDQNDLTDQTYDHHQDQLLFSFEEFIKILTVCERMIEIGEQFCRLYHNDESMESSNTTVEFQNTLYQQTRAYFQSYHQVSMSELKIFLENEIWTRCPIETNDEFELIANLQEFSFMKNRLLKMKTNWRKNSSWSSTSKSSKSTSPTRSSNFSSFLLSPVMKTKKYLNASYFQSNEDANEDELTPFDGIITGLISQQTFEDSDSNLDDDSDMDDVGSSVLEIVTTNTTLNVLRLMGRYMNIMFLLRPISHDIIKALLELFDYYFYTVYHFFALDILNASWMGYSNSLNLQNEIISTVTNQSIYTNNSNQQQARLLLNPFSSFIRRINDTLILNDSSIQQTDQSSSTNSPSKGSPTKNAKYSCPTLPECVYIDSSSNHYALGERIMAIHSLIFIARQFYHLCPFLLEFLRFEDEQPFDSSSQNILNRKKFVEDGFKLLQFYYDKMCSSVESLQFQCLYAVSSKLFSYESVIQQMNQTKWDLKEIPSIHSPYVNFFVKELMCFDPAYRKLLESHDLGFSIPNDSDKDLKTPSISAEDVKVPLVKLYILSQRMNLILWQCILRISNRTFVEGFSSARKCTNEGRALMQLDYEQFLSHIEKIMRPYFKASTMYFSDEMKNSTNNKTIKSYLATERFYVEEFVKAFYITESTFIEWVRQKPDYTTKQIVSLINCITADNKKLRSSLLAAVDTSSIEHNSSTTTNNNYNNNNTSTNADQHYQQQQNNNINHNFLLVD